MFTTANSFHLVLIIQPVNSPTTFLSRTTLTSWCNSLPVSLAVLVNEPNILDLFLTSYPSPYTVKLFSPLGSSDHLLISVSCSVSSSLPQEWPPPSARRSLWHFGAANWSDLRLYFSDFPWNDYCFRGRGPSECAERITEVILSGMKAYIPFFPFY